MRVPQMLSRDCGSKVPLGFGAPMPRRRARSRAAAASQVARHGRRALLPPALPHGPGACGARFDDLAAWPCWSITLLITR